MTEMFLAGRLLDKALARRNQVVLAAAISSTSIPVPATRNQQQHGDDVADDAERMRMNDKIDWGFFSRVQGGLKRALGCVRVCVCVNM